MRKDQIPNGMNQTKTSGTRRCHQSKNVAKKKSNIFINQQPLESLHANIVIFNADHDVVVQIKMFFIHREHIYTMEML